jgi:hypothetical protein
MVKSVLPKLSTVPHLDYKYNSTVATSPKLPTDTVAEIAVEDCGL